MAAAIQVEQVSKRYRLGVRGGRTLQETLGSRFRGRASDPSSELWALNGVSFEIADGETVGVVGANGAGKSTLLRILSRITQPTAGVSRTRGRVGSLLEVGTGFHQELSGRENIFLNGAILGMKRREIRSRFDEIVAFSGVERFLDTPLKRYSSGMYLRLAFAVAAHVDPDILVVDEVLAVGDAAFREKCLGRMTELGREGRTVLFVSHDLGAVARICPRVLWLERGRLRDDGRSAEVIEHYVQTALPRGGRAEFAPEPGKRVQLLSVAVTDREGRTLDAPRRDREFTLSARFLVREDGAPLDLAFVLRNRQGMKLLDEDLAVDTGDDLQPGPVPQTYEARLTVPPVLPAGDYVVGFWIGTAYDTYFFGEALSFELGRRPDDPQWAIDRERAVQPDTEWTVVPVETGERAAVDLEGRR
ncbi:MAG TPA: ABC transporter ATP-binding protein [Gaiellaceae bacterium]|nr:ABC transporter ATP-binding protein [Gaiellaceae bacterium]